MSDATAPDADRLAIERLYSKASVAELLDVSVSTVDRLIARKKLDRIDVNDMPTGTATWRITESSILAYIEECRSRPKRAKVRSPNPKAKATATSKRPAASTTRRGTRLKPKRHLV